jgi:hypothetical protein
LKTLKVKGGLCNSSFGEFKTAISKNYTEFFLSLTISFQDRIIIVRHTMAELSLL